ncbi:MAG TPA: peptidylprolyl isomerase [Thermoanaerobaculia bacterium]|nr:peptidylprolyl isomerase [Thermoanaerobaculia bacterium]
MKKTIATIMALALSATMAVAQEKVADPIVVAAGDLSIRQSEFEDALKTLPQEYQQYASGPGKKQFAEDYVRMKLLASEGMKAGLDKDPEVIKQLNLMRENLVANAQLQKIEKAIALTDAELQAKYDAKKNEYEQVTAHHILIAFKGSPAAQEGKPELTEEQAKAKAEELRNSIVGGGAKFEDVAKKESDDAGSGANGGDLGSFNRGQMVPEFEKAAFEAKVGEVTPVVRTQFGYHVIRVDAHDVTPFDQVKAFIERNERQEKLKAAIEAMKTKAPLTYNEAYFAPPPAPEAAPAPEAKPETKQ